MSGAVSIALGAYLLDNLNIAMPSVPSVTFLGENINNTIYTKASVAGYFTIGSGVLAFVWELVIILLRFCNIGLLNLKATLFIMIVSQLLLYNTA